MQKLDIVGVSIEQVRPLLEANALQTDDLDESMVELLGISELDSLIGCIGVEWHGAQALVRSLAVDSAHRRSGIGAALIGTALERAKANDAAEAFGVTIDAATYLSRFGFESIEREAVTGAITTSTQLRGACPKAWRERVDSLYIFFGTALGNVLLPIIHSRIGSLRSVGSSAMSPTERSSVAFSNVRVELGSEGIDQVPRV